MKKYILLIWILIQFSTLSTFAQTTYASIGNTEACDSTFIYVPVNIKNFINVGAITMFIGFDTLSLNDVSIENINSQFPGLLYKVIYGPDPKIGVSWTSIIGANVASGKLFDIKLFYGSGISNLVFNSKCEVASTDMDIILVEYTNGLVSPSIEITGQPEDQTVNEPDEADFSVFDDGGENFQWQRSIDGGGSFFNLVNSEIFFGVNTDELTISATSGNLNNNLFRCKISNSNCLLYSESALLTVLPMLQIQTVEFSEGWNSYSTYLLPVDTEFEVIFAEIMASVQIISDGDGVYYPSGDLNTIGDFDPRKGYILKLITGESFNLSGYDGSGTTLQIPSGVSFLPVLSPCNITVGALIGENISNVEIIRELPGLNMVWPAQDINTLIYLETGKTYQIEAFSSFEIIFPPRD